MLEEFLKYIEEKKIVSKNGRVLLAVSGGIDSMVMTDLFLSAGFETGIAHCNFCLRGEESDGDENMVRKFASDHKVPFYTIRFDTKAYAKEKGISIQMAARDLRYEWFETIRKDNRYENISVAHNLNDNIETLLLNLIRGTGVAGLTGMKPVSNNIVRPLLFATRQKITEYQKMKGICFREDRSNAETKYTRNKIRHLILPLMKEINPSVEDSLNDTAGKMSEINEILSQYIDGIRNDISVTIGEKVIFDIKKLADHSSNSTMIFELFKPYGITGPSINDLIMVIAGKTGGQLITRSHKIIKNRKDLIITSIEESGSSVSYEIAGIPDLLILPWIKSVQLIRISPDIKIPDDKNIAFLDADKFSFPLVIRNWKNGDVFFPLGMKNKKKLSDYFIDRKFSLIDKEKTLVMESDGKIIWIIGERIDNRFKITKTTTRALKIEIAGF